MKIQMMHGRVECFIRRLIGAGEICRADLATVVEEEAQVDGQIEVDAEDIGLDSSAETDCGVKVDEPLQQRAALVAPRDRDVELQEVQHIGAHLQLQCVDWAGATTAGRRRHNRRRWAGNHWWGRTGRRAAVHSRREGEDSQGEEQGKL